MKAIRGRGSVSNDSGRFNQTQIEEEFNDRLEEEIEESKSIRTEFFSDSSKTIVNENKSPDLGFRYSMNPYRGCEHGCAYCYARPTHEYFNLSAGLDFESKIFVKEKAPELLRAKLASKSWKPEPIFISGVTDCYQPAERKFQLTRRCLEVLVEFRNPCSIVTKNALVTRDIDLLKELASFEAAKVVLSITTLDAKLARALEPRTSSPGAKLEAVEALTAAGIPVGVNVAPVIPGLTDHEIPAILKAAAQAGAKSAAYVPLRLPYSVKSIFTEWLDEHYPERKSKVLKAIRSIRDGALNDAEFGSRMHGRGPRADHIGQVFNLFTQKFGLLDRDTNLSSAHFKKPEPQLELF